MKLVKYCFVEKGYDIKKHIEEYKSLFPTEFIIKEIDEKDFQWEELNTKSGKNYMVPKSEWVDSLTEGLWEEYGYNLDIISFFPARAWENGKNKLYGVRMGRKSNNYDYNATRRRRSLYYGTAEHEDLHAVDEIVREHAGIRLELLMGVKNFDDDIVHRASSRKNYNFDDVWKKISPFLKTALIIRRKKGQPVPPEKPVPVIPQGAYYKPANFSIHELVSPELLARVGEDVCWQMFDERLLRNLQWLRERFGVTYVNIKNRFKYRGFDANEFRKSGTSQHNHGRAIDCHFKDYSIEQVHDILKKEYMNMPEPNIWVEATHNGNKIGWLHMDVRYSDKQGIYFFNA